ncbi:MAG: flagellar brake protein [Rhodocyclaceae bacterium]|nr:flagellar brake protein [Rhodocyclaceae bacterium]
MSTPSVSAEELEKFTTTNRREILFYLNQLINDGERVSVIFDEGQETVLTVLLDIDEAEDMLIFDWGGSEAANRKLLRSERNLFVCAPHGVRNQFVTGPVHETQFKNRPAFKTRLPKSYTRLQRREFFRLVLPITRRPVCIVPREGGKPLELSVIDISIGGVAVELPGAEEGFEIGQLLPRARLELKGIGTLEVDLEVRNRALVQHGSKQALRLGCSFARLGRGMENQLQRFITEVQREERARLGL